MPQMYSRSRARFSGGGDSTGGRGYPRRPGGGNSLLKVLVAIVIITAVVLIPVIFWNQIAEVFGINKTEPTASPTQLLEESPLPTASLAPEPTPDTGQTPEPDITPEVTPEPTPTPEPFVDFTISAVGNIITETALLTNARNADTGEYDFAPFLANIKGSLSKSDLTIGTLEATLAGKDATYSGATRYNTPESILTALKDSGFDMLNTAHTHIFDKGFDGVQKTIEFMNAQGIYNTGTYLSAEDYHKVLFVPLAEKNIQVAILAYSNDEKYKSSISSDKMRFAIKHINLETIKKDVKNAREQGANVVIVMMHWGTESAKSPTEEMKNQAKKIVGYGADLIIGSHPLVLQKLERIKTEREDGTAVEGIVAYSLGSFLTSQQTQYKDTAMILNVTFTKDTATNAVTIKEASYIPTWMYRNSKQEYTILPAGKYKDSAELLATLTTTAKTRIKKAWEEALALIGNEVATPAAE